MYGYFCGLCTERVDFDTWDMLKQHVNDAHQIDGTCDYCKVKGKVNVSGLGSEPLCYWCPDEQACDERIKLLHQGVYAVVPALIPDYAEV